METFRTDALLSVTTSLHLFLYWTSIAKTKMPRTIAIVDHNIHISHKLRVHTRNGQGMILVNQ